MGSVAWRTNPQPKVENTSLANSEEVKSFKISFACKTESSNGNGLETNGMFSVKDDRELIFPPELRVRAAELCAESVTFIGEKVTWFRPSTLDELLHLKNGHPDAKFIGGNTEIGVETKLKNMHYPKFIQTSQVRF